MLDPVSGSLGLLSIFAVLPLVPLLVLVGPRWLALLQSAGALSGMVP